MVKKSDEHPSVAFVKCLYQRCDQGFIGLLFLPAEKSFSIRLSEIETIPAILDAHKDQDCHFAIATRINGDGPGAEIHQIPFLWAELNLYKLTDKEKEEGRQGLKNFPLKPTFTIDYGGGRYFLWMLKEVACRDEIQRMKGILNSLASYFHGNLEATDANYSLRMPGSLNHKYPHTPQVAIKDFHPEREYRLDDFEILSQVEGITTREEKSRLLEGKDEWKREEGQPIPSAKPAQENVQTKFQPEPQPKMAPPVLLEIELNNFLKGAFVISRSIFNSEVWLKPPIFQRCWVWMIGQANHQDVKKGDFIYHRGEFYTSYDEIREALTFYQNHKRMTPSLKQARYILAWFTHNEMTEITPVKTHEHLTNISANLTNSPHSQGGQGQTTGAYKGLRIRLIKYDLYQLLENYKGRPQGQTPKNELGQTKGRPGADLGHNNKNDKNKKIYVEGSIELRLTTLLLEQIQKNKPDFKQPILQSWAKEVDLMIRRDGRKPERIQQVVEWCQRDSFWWRNILSPGTLRKQFDRLEAEMMSKKSTDLPQAPRVRYQDLTGGGIK